MNHTPTQLDLFGSVAPMSMMPPLGKIDTSQAAAASIAPLAGELRQRVFNHIASCRGGGATADEIQLALRLPAQTVTPRCNELLQMKRIVRSGLKRPTASGRLAHVYVIASANAGEVAE